MELQAGFVEIATLLDLPEQNATNPSRHSPGSQALAGTKRVSGCSSSIMPMHPSCSKPITRVHPEVTSCSPRERSSSTRWALPDHSRSRRWIHRKHWTFSSNAPHAPRATRKKRTPLSNWPLNSATCPWHWNRRLLTSQRKAARFQDYLASFQRQRLSLLNKAQPRTGKYPASVASTWALNFQEVEQDPVAADILRVSAFLSPDAIPLELLTEGASQLGPVLAEALATSEDPLVLNEALEPLTRYSLIRLDVDTQTYSIHRMVQEVVKDQMGARVTSAVGRTRRASGRAELSRGELPDVDTL